MQYFGSFYTPASGFVTAPLCDEIRLLGLTDDGRRAALQRVAQWEEASAWLAQRMEEGLARVVVAAAAAAGGAEPRVERQCDDNDDLTDVVAEAPVLSSSHESLCPSWWVTPCESMFLVSELQQRAYEYEQMLKVSIDSVVLLARRRTSGVNVVVKLYQHEPVSLLRTLKWLHTPNVKRNWIDGGDIVDVVDDFAVTLGHVVVFTRLDVMPVCQCAPALDVLARLTELLNRLHAIGIVHGDVHPGNVAWNPTTCRVGLFDFDECCSRLDLPEAEWLRRRELELTSLTTRCKRLHSSHSY